MCSKVHENTLTSKHQKTIMKQTQQIGKKQPHIYMAAYNSREKKHAYQYTEMQIYQYSDKEMSKQRSTKLKTYLYTKPLQKQKQSPLHTNRHNNKNTPMSTNNHR